jgi:hypothetical protein
MYHALTGNLGFDFFSFWVRRKKMKENYLPCTPPYPVSAWTAEEHVKSLYSYPELSHE